MFKHSTPLVSVLVLAGILAAIAAAAPKQASLVIRHQTRGCHSWSLNGGAYAPSQSLTLARGGSISVTNNDVMPHQLVETSGAAAAISRLSRGMGMGKSSSSPSMLARMGAAAKITFTKPGLYRFTTKPGEDYMKGIKTVGDDNVLRLTVRVK